MPDAVKMFIPQQYLDKLESPEVTGAIKKVMMAVAVLRKASIDTEDFRITAWATPPVEGGKRSVTMRIEEM